MPRFCGADEQFQTGSATASGGFKGWFVVNLVICVLIGSAGCTGRLSQDSDSTGDRADASSGTTPVDPEDPYEPVDPDDPEECVAGSGDRGPTIIRRLTVPEYVETARHSLGLTDVADDVRGILPGDISADGFTNTAYNLTVDLGHIEGYAELAELLVERMDVADFVDDYASCRELNQTCMREVIDEVGKWVLRGPVTDQEATALMQVYETVASEGGDFDEASAYILEAMLQSPRFIYRVENQRGDGQKRAVSAYALASRLSYFIWGGPPDAALMEAADNDALAEQSQLQGQVERMLASPRATDRSKRFVQEWLSLQRLNFLAPNTQHFPEWNDQLAADMRKETLRYFEYLAWDEQRPVADLFNASVTFATPDLARHYGLEPKGDGVRKYDLSAVPERGGLLTQGSVLTVGGDEASMVARGLFVLHNILCGGVSEPPPDVDTTPVPAEPGISQREIAEGRVADPTCGGCHIQFEPLAYGLAKFDGIGTYREIDEHGNDLRDDGAVLFPGTSQPVAYDKSSELMDLLADSAHVQACLTGKAAQFAIGRRLNAADRCIMGDIQARASAGGGTYASLVAAIATSDLVTLTRTEEVSDGQ
jgi:hypothetical protein